MLDGLGPVKVLGQKVTHILRAWNPVDHEFVLVDPILNEASFFPSLRRRFALRLSHDNFVMCCILQRPNYTAASAGNYAKKQKSTKAKELSDPTQS